MISLGKYKPAASVRTHLLVAALMWGIVGLVLLTKGFPVLLSDGQYLFLIAALSVGTMKSLLLLDRVATRNIDRICAFGQDTCLGGVYSVKTWVMVLCMILAGRVLRLLAVPIEAIGLLQVAVGWALLLASRKIWRAWLRWPVDSA